MKKRILAFCLAFVMVFGMLPTFALAEENVASAEHLAYYAGDVSVDNTIDETEWYLYGKITDGTDTRMFDVLWDTENLYLAVDGQDGDELTITADDYSSTVILNGAAELAIPMDDLGVTVTGYNQTVPLSLSIGEMVWEGTVTLSSAQRQQLVDGWTNTSPDNESNTTNLRTKFLPDGGMNISRRYGAGSDTSTYDAAFYKNQGMDALAEKLETTSVEFDFVLDKMPEYNRLSYVASIYAVWGFNLVYTNGIIDPETGLPSSVSFGFTNNAGKIYAAVAFGPNDKRVIATDTGKTLGEKFHVQLITTADGDLEIYIDGTLIRTVGGAVINEFPISAMVGGTPQPVLRFSNYANVSTDAKAEDGSADVDFTVWNVKIGSTCGNALLDTLTWDTFRGENTDMNSVTQDLILPDTLDSALVPVDLSWSSSDESVIAADGTVKIPLETTTVTLTATANGSSDLTKQFELTVPAYSMEALLTTESITLDGKLQEVVWRYTDSRDFSIQNGASGTVYALWKAETAYLGVEYANADTMTLSLGDESWEFALSENIQVDDVIVGTAVDGIVELQVDLTAAGIVFEDYNESRRLQIALSGDNASAALEKAPVFLIFAGKYLNSVNNVLDLSTNNGRAWKTGGTVAYSNGELKLAAQTGRTYWLKHQIPALDDHSLDILTEIDMNITEMPVGDGAIASNTSAKGFHFWVTTMEKLSGTSQGYYSFANIYNKGEGALVLKGRDGTDVPLGVNVGERFKLGYQWNADDSVVVYVDGEEVGRIDSNPMYVSGCGDDAFMANIEPSVSGETTTLYFYGLQLSAFGKSTVSLEEELSSVNVLNGINLTQLSNSSVITLPGSWETMLGTFELDYTSSDDSVILTENEDGTWSVTVTQPDSVTNDYSNLTMYANGKSRWSVLLEVPGLQSGRESTPSLLQVPFSAATVAVDGSTTDEGWSFDIKVLKDYASAGVFGAQWDTENLYMAVDTNGLPLCVSIAGKDIDLSSAVTSGDITEFSVPLADLGVDLKDYGTELPAVVTLGEAVWEGTLKLSSNDRWLTDGVAPRFIGIQQGSQATMAQNPSANQGSKSTENGWRFFDLYDPAGNNPIGVRSYLIFSRNSGTEEEQQLYQPINDRTKSTYLEFDFYARSMPEYVEGSGDNGASDFSPHFSNYGLNWAIAGKRNTNADVPSISLGIYNTEDGLVLCVQGKKTSHVNLGKNVGDQFRVGTRWEKDGSLTIFIDGAYFASFDDVEITRSSFGDTNIVFNLIRNGTPAASGADSMDVYISNISLGKAKGDSIFDALTEEMILADNEDALNVTTDLNLVTSLYDDQIDITAEGIQWSSSDETVIATDGTVTRPAASGKVVVLTATWNGMTKEFTVYVKGLSFSSNTLVVFNDLDTASGSGEPFDTAFFTLDTNNNSIVLDQEVSKRFNLVTLNDGDGSNRLNESLLTLWVSDDNNTYTRIDSFKLKNIGSKVYLYGFDETARYIKVHSTEFRPDEADLTAPLEGMIEVGLDETLFAAAGTAVTVTNNTAETKYDTAWTVDGTYAGNLRVWLNGELLYHYVEDGKLTVRIPELAAGETVTLTVVSAEDGLDIANKEYTLEVVYGIRETRIYTNAGRWLAALPDGRLISTQYGYGADGEIGENGENWLTYAFSSDGGLTWTEPVEIECSRGWLVHQGGITYDPNNGRILVMGTTAATFNSADVSSSYCRTRLVYSDDMGQTWKRCPEFAFDGETATYYTSYTAPLIVSSYDGEDGDGIDMVFSNAVQYGNDGSFCCRVAYSTDAGKTWTMGKDKIRYAGEGHNNHEGGISECTILEDENVPGKLVLYGRCQFESVDVFAKTYSYDYGKTWEAAAQLSEVYTANTQPMFHQFGDADLLFWGGNNVLGGISYQRMPMNVAISYDNAESFVNIQDLYARTSLQGMTTATRNQIINQSVTSQGDTVTIAWENNFLEYLIMRVENFTDWFYRTKGAYDSFENSTVKAEGWSVTRGNAVRSEDQAAEGSFSMLFNRGSAAVRSIPYVQDGEISMKLYLTDEMDFTMELESAYSSSYGKAAPVGFAVENGVLTFLGAEAASDVTFAEGWNDISFALNLSAEEPTVSLTVNGKTVEAPVNTDIGDYVCWFDINAGAPMYVDMFHVVDTDPIDVPAAPTAPEQPEKDPTIAGTTMTLGNNLALNFLVEQACVTGEGWYAEIIHGDKVTTVPQADWTASGDYLRISYNGLAAKEMTDEVIITIYDANGKELTSKTDSIRAYAMRMFGVEEAFDTVLADMLNYGAAAQIQFKYKTDDLANSLMTDEQKACATVAVEMADIRESASGYQGATLELESNIVLNFYYSKDYVGKTATVSYTDHYGKNYNYAIVVEANGSMGKVSVDKLVISDCSVKVTVTIDGVSVVDSVESYCARMTTLALGEPLMKFAISAKNYFAK